MLIDTKRYHADLCEEIDRLERERDMLRDLVRKLADTLAGREINAVRRKEAFDMVKHARAVLRGGV